jgi:hypothetical protein
MKKTLAYCAAEFITVVKSFMIQDPGVESHIQIMAVICSLDCTQGSCMIKPFTEIIISVT